MKRIRCSAIDIFRFDCAFQEALWVTVRTNSPVQANTPARKPRGGRLGAQEAGLVGGRRCSGLGNRLGLLHLHLPLLLNALF